MCSKTHEYCSNKFDEEFLLGIASEFGRCDLINEKPGGEKEANGHEDEGEMGKYCRVDWAYIAGH